MRGSRTTPWPACAVLTLAAVLAACGEAAVAPEVGPALADSLQAALDEVSAASGVVGAQAAVIIPGIGTWTGVYGRSGAVTAMRPDLAVPVGSVAKTVVSGLVLHLVDRGLVRLDDTVGALLPPLPNVPPAVTVRQLLQNTSGIASFSSGAGFTDSLAADRDRRWTAPEIVARFVGPPEFAPGTSWRSSNTGYLLGAMIAEAVTGETLADLYGQALYGPLDLGEMFHPGTEPARAPTAEAWTGPAGGPLVSFTRMYDGPSFQTGRWPLALVVSARSLARWGEALFTDFLGPAVRAEMLTAVDDDGGIPNQVGAGVGVRKFDFLGRTQWGHSGTTAGGSGMLLWDEASGIVVALTYNQNGGSHRSSHFTLAPRLLALALAAR